MEKGNKEFVDNFSLKQTNDFPYHSGERTNNNKESLRED